MKTRVDMKKETTSEITKLPVTFGSGDVKLTGEILFPNAKHPVPGAILCHGLGSGYRAVESSARIIANHGVAVLIFDFRGHGCSSGILDGNMVEDVVDAWHFLSMFPGIHKRRIALIGHSMGAMAAILAARKVKPRALIALSCPPEVDSSLTASDLATLNNWIKRGSTVEECPRDGAFPWQKGLVAILTRVWMYLAGYNLSVDWRAFFEALKGAQMSAVLHDLTGCSTLFVHCRGDSLTPYRAAVELYEHAEQPKDLLLARGGSHSTPLLPGNLRRQWTEWAVHTLTA